jgi:hypothetical protein
MVVLLLRGIQRMNNINVGCPRCGSLNVKVVSDITETTKGFGAGKGCLGYISLGPIGLLCGMLGMGKTKTKTNTYRVCADCGARFK